MHNQTESSSEEATTTVESRKGKCHKLSKPAINNRVKWRSEPEQRIYSTKLLNTLRLFDQTQQNAVVSSRLNPHNIRAAAYQILATTAKGRTRWSRAILKRRRFRSRKFQKVQKNPNKTMASKHTRLLMDKFAERPEVEKRVEVLGRLVPGCSKVTFPRLLEETTDYIAALEMQVRAMTTLVNLLGSAGGVPAGGDLSPDT